VRDCNPKNEELWSELSRAASKIELEPDHDLDEYHDGLKESLAKAWGLDRKCGADSPLCDWFVHRIKASPYMLSEIIVRASLLKGADMNFDFYDVVEGMGDMVEKVK